MAVSQPRPPDRHRDAAEHHRAAAPRAGHAHMQLLPRSCEECKLKDHLFLDSSTEQAFFTGFSSLDFARRLAAAKKVKAPCITIDGREITGRLRASLHRHVKIARIQRHAREKGGLWWGDADRVDWDMMMAIKPKKVNDREYMRHMWGQLPTHDKPWMKDEGGKCPCGCDEPETQWHLIRACGGKGMTKLRKKAIRVAWTHLYSNRG